MNPRRLLYLNLPASVGYNPIEGEYDIVDVSWDYFTNPTLKRSLEPLKAAKMVVADNSKLAGLIQRKTNIKPVMAHYGELAEITVHDTPEFTVGFLCHSLTAYNNLRVNHRLIEHLHKKFNCLTYVDPEMAATFGETKYATTSKVNIFASKIDLLCLPSPINSVNALSPMLSLMLARTGIFTTFSNYAEIGHHEGSKVLPDNTFESWEKAIREMKNVKMLLTSMKDAARKLATKINSINRNKVETNYHRILQTNKESK